MTQPHEPAQISNRFAKEPNTVQRFNRAVYNRLGYRVRWWIVSDEEIRIGWFFVPVLGQMLFLLWLCTATFFAIGFGLLFVLAAPFIFIADMHNKYKDDVGNLKAKLSAKISGFLFGET